MAPIISNAISLDDDQRFALMKAGQLPCNTDATFHQMWLHTQYRGSAVMERRDRFLDRLVCGEAIKKVISGAPHHRTATTLPPNLGVCLAAFHKFRRSVLDCMRPEHDDYYLLRWLRARQWNAEAAEKMLRDSLAWREKWGVDTTLCSWEPSEVLLKYFPSGSPGFDKEGAPVYIVPFAGLDIWGLLHTVSRSDMIRMIIRTLEHYLALAAAQGSKYGPAARKLVCVMDMEAFSMRQYAWRPAGELVISLLQMYEANYPEILKICYIVNAPKVFSLAFSIVKKFMHEYTLSKIKIYKADPKKWQAALLASIDAEQLPPHYGGTLQDESGDPRCTALIPLGGKVPKHFHTRHNSQDKGTQFTRVTVKKGDKHAVDLICAQPGCFLRWEFGVENHDIKFMIVSRDEEGRESCVHGPRNVSGAATDTGLIAVHGPATYTVTFDNSYSYMRCKKVYYDVLITMPVSELNISSVPGEDGDMEERMGRGEAGEGDVEHATDALTENLSSTSL